MRVRSCGGIPVAWCEATGGVGVERSSLEDPRTIGQRMLSLDLAAFTRSVGPEDILPDRTSRPERPCTVRSGSWPSHRESFASRRAQ
jgi:hypothetical protein